MKALVLGCGLVGSAIVADLAKKGYKVTVCDISESSVSKILSPDVIKITGDVNNKNFLEKLSDGFDFIINATPGFMAFNVLRNLIELQKNVIDISFFPEDALELNDLAVKNRVMVIYDCGVAPGLSNFVSGYAASLFDEVEELKIFVGGLPKERMLPFEYKAVFSPVDVIEEYTRPVYLIRDYKEIIAEPLTETEQLVFSGIGTLEAANTDGLRSLTKTLKVKNMAEKTLRYPGYYDKIRFLKSAGLFDTGIKEINGIKISPFEMTSKVLIDKWKLNPGEEDLTVMAIMASGIKDGEKKSFRFDLYDEYDKDTNTHSMARTTGYTATTFFELMTQNEFQQKGVIPLEKLADHKFFNKIIGLLKQRGFSISIKSDFDQQ